MEISKEKIKNDDEYYLYIITDRDKENKNVYRSLKVQYAINEKEKGFELYKSKFYYSKINDINKQDYYIINKQSDLNQFIIIDIAEKIPVQNDLGIKTEFEKNLIKEINYNGRRRIIANVINNEGIKLYIQKNNEDKNNKFYSINYYLVDNLSNFENFTNIVDTLSISENKLNKNK